MRLDLNVRENKVFFFGHTCYNSTSVLQKEAKVLKKFKMNIFRRTLLLSLSTALLSFLAFGLISSYHMKNLFQKSIDNGKDVGEKMVHFTEEFAINQAKERLASLAFERSRQIEQGMSKISNDAESIALQMNRILSNPDNYKEIKLPNVKKETVYNGNPYIYFPIEAEKKGITDELKREAGLSSNIVDVLNIVSHGYAGHQTTSYIASKNGFLILIETSQDKNAKVTFPNDFEPRERIWYVDAEKAQKTIITDVYQAIQLYPAISCATPYYDANGEFAGVAAVDANLESLYDLITKNRIGDTSINFTLSNKGEIIISSTKTGTFAVSKDKRDCRDSLNKEFAKEAANMVAGQSNVVLLNVDGKEYCLAYSPMPTVGWSFGTVIEKEEIIKPVNKAKAIINEITKNITHSIELLFSQHMKHLAFTIFLVLLWLLWISFKDSKKFVTPIVMLTDGVKEIAKGNLDNKLDIKTGDEIEDLAESVNNMTSDLKKYIENLSKVTADKERIATELTVARNIQAGMLPSVEPNFSNKKEFDLAATMIPAKEVGGDFYDFYMLDENNLALTVADVSGKGVGAALFMSISKSFLKNNAKFAATAHSEGNELNLASIMEQTNQQLIENNEEKMFVTVFFGVLNLKSGEFAYVNAGHNPPLVCHKSEGQFTFIRNEKKNCIIGISKKAKYQEHHLTLNPGDILFFYTDGITEAMNEQSEQFHENNLKVSLDSISEDSNANKILSTVYEAVKKHAGNAEQSDDMTMLGLIYKGEK